MRKPLIFFLVLFITTALTAQVKDAKNLIAKGNYIDALPILLNEHKKAPEDAAIARLVSQCYLNSYINKKEALKYIEKVYYARQTPQPDLIYEYALALTYHLRYEDAKSLFIKYKNTGKGSYQKKVGMAIKNCDKALELMEKPLNISIENLGEKVNTAYPDYYPFVSKNDSVVFFTSRRPGNVGGSKEFDGYYPADIFYYRLHDPNARAKNVGKMLNTTGDDQVVGLSNDGRVLFIYFDVIDYFGDIYMARNNNGKFTRNFKLTETVNSEALETSASMSADGQVLFFASSRPGGYGGLDIYSSRRLPDGSWGLPQNLGEMINTPENEDFPQLSADGKTLYFSSTGIPGMGGADIFMSDWNEELNVWSDPVNIGFPLNTPDDDMTISFSNNEEFAYISARRDDSFGFQDIYRVTFHNNTKNKTVIVFEREIGVFDDSIELILYDDKNEIIGIYHPDKKGKIIAILKKGHYNLEIEDDLGVIYQGPLIVSNYHINQGTVLKTINTK